MLIVWIGFAATRKVAPESFRVVGIRGFVIAYCASICFVALRAAVGSAAFINALVAELFVLLPYVSIVVLPAAIYLRSAKKLGTVVCLVVSVGVAITLSYLNQYLAIQDTQLAISRGNSLISSVILYAVAVTTCVLVGVSVAARIGKRT